MAAAYDHGYTARMGALRRIVDQYLVQLEAEHLIGRSVQAALRLDESYVSGQHASIRWVGDFWEIKDLGSRNGTIVGGVMARPGHPIRLNVGSVMSFGQASQAWELTDDLPPRPMVVPLDQRAQPILLESEMLALPSSDNPVVTLFRGLDGAWTLEYEDATVPVLNQQIFEVAGERFRLSCLAAVSQTTTVDWHASGGLEIRQAQLYFRVSLDEEHVELRVVDGDHSTNLGSRSHNYLLLLLARQRLADGKLGVAEGASGWVYQEDLLHGLRLSAEHLNIDIFRIRKQFSTLGLIDPVGIIERRPRSKQLRIGTGKIAIEPL